jgi:hypothetical protein
MASSFSTLIQRGYGTIYAVRIEGIPYTFHEGPTPYRVDAESPPGAGANYTSSAAFVVLKDMTIDQEIDRHSSISRGKGLTLNLAWSVMEAEDILDKLFRRPAYFTTLTADVGAEDEEIEVVDSTDFGSVSHAGQFYIGRELVKYTGTTATSFTGCERGYLGYAYRFRKDDPGSHGMITPTPLSWKGRFVTIYEHIVSPEGRILDDTFCEGTYQRELWKGYINAPPVPNAFGMTLSALPLIRLAGQQLGSSLRGKTIGLNPENTGLSTAELLSYPIYVGEGASCAVTIYLATDVNPTAGSGGTTSEIAGNFPKVVTGAVEGDWPTIPPGPMTIRTYVQAMIDEIMDFIPSPSGGEYSTTGMTIVEDGPPGVVVVGVEGGDWNNDAGGFLVHKIGVAPSSGVYWLAEVSSQQAFGIMNWDVGELNFTVGLVNPPYLAIRDIEGNSAIDFTINTTGLGLVEAGDNSEVLEWDAKYSEDYLGNSFSPWALIRISAWMVGAEYSTVQQLPADLTEDGEIEIVAGIVADLDTAALSLLESSGTGLRGDEDTLGLGMGLGIPAAFINLNGAGGAPITAETLPILAIGRTSWGDLFSGWYAISGVCLVQRRDTDGVIRLTKVYTAPSMVISTTGASFLGVELSKSDVVVGGTQVPKLIVAPNQIIVDTTAGPYESADYTYNAVGRIQSEGAMPIELGIPGGRPDIIAGAIVSLMSRGLGQSIIQFKIAPWVDVELGDPVAVTVGHPVLFDWSDGTRQPSNIPGRVVGTSYKLKSGEKTATILLDGLLEPGFWLCPTTQVASVSGDDVTVTDGTWFRSGETVRFYKEGNEGSEDVSIVATTVSGNVLSLASTPPAWFNVAPKAYATYPVYTSGSTEQTAAFMYDRSDRRWR